MFKLSFKARQNLQTGVVLSLAAMFLASICYLSYVGAEGGSHGVSVSDDARILNAARGIGLKNPRVVGPASVFECGSEDSWFASARVEGTNIHGNRVSAVVCCGLISGLTKSCTARF